MTVRLKTLSHGLFAGVLLALLANFAFVVLIRTAFESSTAAGLQREQTLRAVEQLRRETDLLRRLVRAYTATGDSRHLLAYYDIYAVLQGDKPAPTMVDPALAWEEAIARRTALPQGLGGPRRSLVERLKALQVSPAELDALQQVLAATDRLKKTEQVAFAATQGLYDAHQNTFVSEGEPDLAFATRLVHARPYEEDGAALTRAIALLAQRSDARTEAAVSDARSRLTRYIGMAVAVDVALIPVMGLALLLVRRRVLQPIDELSSRADAFAHGRYAQRGDARNAAVAEVQTLSRTMDAMAQAIEDDLAARTQVQADLQAARDQAEAATKAKSLFLANMSHEIRTPMNAIIGMTHLALQTSLTPQQQDYLGKVDAASQILLGVINDILDFSKIEAGHLSLENTPYRVEDVVGNALTLVRQKAQDKELELLCEFSDPSLLSDAGVVQGDPLRVGQILINLLSNAVKFTHSGHVKIRVGWANRQGTQARLQVDVQDTGIGMNPDQIGRLFQEFTQADESTTRRYGGTGLGLSISQRLAGLMGGGITVDSRQGAGTTFTLTLPVTIVTEAARDDTAWPPCRPAEALRVLVVDDQAETRNSLAGLLSTMGVGRQAPTGPRGRVDAAASGLAALAMARAAEEAGEPYDLVLLDWVLPDMDGAEVTDRLRQSHPGLGVVVISAYGWDSLHATATQAGADSFLPKPILPAALRTLFGRMTGIAAPAATTAGTAEQAVRLDGLRVLLAEDNALNQQLAIELLSRRGAIVKLVDNGCEAVEHLRMSGPGAYDVVLMDLQMPMMDGYEATQQIRADQRFDALPIVAMTAHALAEERHRCMAVGMQDHISKPLEPHKLYAVLARYHGGAAAPRAIQSLPGAARPADAHGKDATVLQALALAAGLDAAAALGHADGNPALALRVLRGFAQHLEALREPLPRAAQEGDWATLGREGHTLRGLAATVGAAPLAQQAAALEAAAGQHDPAAARYCVDALLRNAQPLLLAVAGMAPLEGPAEPPSPSAHLTERPATAARPGASPASGLDPAMKASLAAHLADCDSQAVDLWRRQRDAFRRALPPDRFRRLETAIESCDFDAALHQLTLQP